MKITKITLLALIFLMVVVPIANSTTDEILNDFFLQYASTFKIEPIWAAEVKTMTGDQAIATLSLVKFDWVDKDGNKNVQKRFYANYKGQRHFSDGQNDKTAMEYPSGICKTKAPDGSCGVTHIDFMFQYKHADGKYYFYRFNLEVEPETGMVKDAEAKEITIDETKLNQKADIEEIGDVSRVKLDVADQNGALSENLVRQYQQVG
ncbi:MAG: hypothetical protein AABX25_04195 [Nanoarchaeota archaeon]